MKSRATNRGLVLLLAIVLMTSSTPSKVGADEVALGFDGVPDLSLDLDDFGVHFTGAQVLACGGSLNCPQFPPFSGDNVIYDVENGVIVAQFDSTVTGEVDKVSARITGNRNVTMTAFGAAGEVRGTMQTGGANFVGAGTGIAPNKLLEITSTEPIARVTFHDSGNTYTIDDFAFRGSSKSVVIDAGHGYIVVNGVNTFQRGPSPTFGLIEDVLALDISRSVRTTLQSGDVKVLLTRETDAAPFAPRNCAVPCFADLNKRARWAEKQEPDLLLSVHTNAGPPTANGTETFYSTVAPSPKSAALAGTTLTRVVALGLRSRGVKVSNFNIINTIVPSALVEVAFHSNSQLAAGQGVTDEARLNSSAFRGAAGAAIAHGIQDYYALP